MIICSTENYSLQNVYYQINRFHKNFQKCFTKYGPSFSWGIRQLITAYANFNLSSTNRGTHIGLSLIATVIYNQMKAKVHLIDHHLQQTDRFDDEIYNAIRKTNDFFESLFLPFLKKERALFEFFNLANPLVQLDEDSQLILINDNQIMITRPYGEIIHRFCEAGTALINSDQFPNFINNLTVLANRAISPNP